MIRLPVVAITLLIFATNAVLAAEFYVGQDPSTKKCKIVKTKPDGKTLAMVGTSSYGTRDEAKTARKSAAECQKATKQ
jgi:hypothetical protein